MSIRIENLRHLYAGTHERPVLEISGWRLDAGEQVLLRGISGSGKTTLFNILSGLLRPTAGEVYYDSQPLFALSESARDRFRARHIGYVFQTHNLISSLNALENVRMPLAFARTLSPAEQRRQALDLLASVGLAGYANRLPARMSTGQRLRVAVARALANTPRILLADEPTAALDVDSGEMVIDLLQTACDANRATLIVASHDPALVSRFTRHAALEAGLLREGQPA